MAVVTSFSYDQGDKLISPTDPDGNTIQFSYDGQGRTTMETNALGQKRIDHDDTGRRPGQ
jgi:YD repeat-containing protein